MLLYPVSTNGEASDVTEGAEMRSETTIHNKVLRSLTDAGISECNGLHYELRIEKTGGRLDLPLGEHLQKSPGQRKDSLLYTDAMLLEQGKPRILLEIVDSSPKNPNGIVGLTVNADRIADLDQYTGVSLLFIVLTEMKEYFCQKCGRGHKILSTRYSSHFESLKNHYSQMGRPIDILHEGIALNFRKALRDYPIEKHLHNIMPPVVLFLNRAKINGSWEGYREHAHELIRNTVTGILKTPNRKQCEFEGLEELFP